jgi:hypothetical protein
LAPMTTLERLQHWKQQGIVTKIQYETLSALIREERFSLFLEFNALLYLGVISIAGGLAWTFTTHSETLGDVFILAVLTTILAVCLYPILLGGLLVGTSVALRRWLSTGDKHGFTATRILRSDRRAISIAGTASAACCIPRNAFSSCSGSPSRSRRRPQRRRRSERFLLTGSAEAKKNFFIRR